MTDVFLLACIPIAVVVGYVVRALTRPGTQRRFFTMAISVPDTSRVTLSLEPTDAKGVPTGPAFTDAVFTPDTPAAVTVSPGTLPGTSDVTLNDGNEPPVLATTFTGTTPSDPSVNATLTVNWEATAQTGATIIPVVTA